MMSLSVMTQTGVKYNDLIDYVVIQNDDGQTAILQNHVPFLTTINKTSYLKIMKAGQESFIVSDRGMVTFNDNELIVFTLMIHKGKTLEEARIGFEETFKEALNDAKRDNVDFSLQERELKKSILKSQAGNL